jgi:acetyl/propionyl-CoA carboxylase alpha subunit
MRLLAHERFIAGDLDTHFLQTEAATLIPAADARSADAQAVAALVRRGTANVPAAGGSDTSSDPWTSLGKRHV